jgi:dihydrolipoamide dehydrogenase
MSEKYDLVVIGSGPGGYVAAIKAAQLGMKTAIVERREIGGTCLNRGCIPTKSLMHSAHLYEEAKNFETLGLSFSDLTFDYQKMHERKDEVVNRIRNGVIRLLLANEVTVMNGFATISNSKTVKVNMNNNIQEITTDKILIATGSKPSIPPIDGISLNHVLTSDELLTSDLFYNKLVIIGGGVIGVEIASIYQALGADVEIIEAKDRLLPTMDREISQTVSMSLKKKGVKIHTKSQLIGITKNGMNLNLEFNENGTKNVSQAEGVLIAIGRKANIDGLIAENIQIQMNGSSIQVNQNFETNIPGIYAIGDAIKGTQLAHAASAQGIAAVEHMCNIPNSICFNVIPACIYTSPEIAVVGMTEDEAKSEGYQVKTSKYPMLGNCKTIIAMDERGYIKVVVDGLTDRILGAQLVCSRATDMIGEFASAIVNNLSVKDMASVIRPHPTYNEAFTEVLEDINGMAIHLMPNKK